MVIWGAIILLVKMASLVLRQEFGCQETRVLSLFWSIKLSMGELYRLVNFKTSYVGTMFRFSFYY